MSEPIWSTGGPGGDRAVTEDLEWAAAALGAAAARIANAGAELARRRVVVELGGGIGPAWVSEELRGIAATAAPRLEADLDDIARRLVVVTCAYLAAERRARRSVGLVDTARAAAADAWAGAGWLVRAAVTAVAATQPLGVLRARGLVPDGPPPTTGSVTRDSVERALALVPYDELVRVIEALLGMSLLHVLSRWRGQLSATPVASPPARSVADVMRGLRDVDVAGGGSVRIERWTDRAGVTRRIVYIPGTQDWLDVTSNPSDLHADVALLAGGLPDAAGVVVAALEADGAGPGDPVLLAGHSLGGIVATALAANPQVRSRFRVEAVVTAGSPTGRIALPPAVFALHLEGTRDIVPGLDGRPNPDTPTRVTVHHDTRESELDALAGEGEDIASAHHLDTYAQTARFVDDGLNASTDAWTDAQREFLDAGKEVVVTEYRPGDQGSA